MNKINYTIVQMSDGSILVGNIINGKAEGHGWIISEPKYEGEFKNDLKHGSGRLFLNSPSYFGSDISHP